MNYSNFLYFDFKTFFAVLLVLACGVLNITFAQKSTSDTSIPAGLYSPLDKFLIKDSNPPLRLSDVTRTAEMIGWVADGRFSNQQFEEFKQIIIAEWQAGNQETIRFITNWVALSDKLKGIKKYADQIALREQILPLAIADFKKFPDDPKRVIARQVYRRAKGENSLAPFKVAPKIVKTNGTLAEVVGDWMLQTGTAPNLKSLKLSILANNRVEFGNMQSAQKGNCFVNQTESKEGTTQVSGNTIKFDFSNNKSQTINSCQAGAPKIENLPAETHQFSWQIKTDENEMLQFCLTGADGKTACYRKTN